MQGLKTHTPVKSRGRQAGHWTKQWGSEGHEQPHIDSYNIIKEISIQNIPILQKNLWAAKKKYICTVERKRELGPPTAIPPPHGIQVIWAKDNQSYTVYAKTSIMDPKHLETRAHIHILSKKGPHRIPQQLNRQRGHWQ